ncbi:alpha-L-fucosidase [Niameybacter massiliensis]|uniref:alpha-L-fucosidase n=1 Tax=Holtiella tumoricola TaxID=3018743 RepID=A0AA42DJ98_9FIRM|nr:alpha-L-fucosidase [Holtiella tumoricola]MDA3729951.1 alpha-L-fucosidase [Holtiella tumoricola]
MSQNTLVERLVSTVPSKRQLAWHELEFYAFIHFGINTFYDREWGNGQEDPAMFNPTELDTDQWVQTIKAAGMKAILLTCKHHDGFCLWPSAYTEFSIKNSPYKDGKGDLVKELAESCKKHDMKFGVYLSPWDQNSSVYGDSEKYDDYFINQLTELLTNYGPIFSVWFDGACGEGPNGKKQIYNWERYYACIRELQPDAVINISGPDIRWCGNEAGHCRESEWNVVPKRLTDPAYTAEHSQQEDNEAFRERPVSFLDQDLGSLEALKDEKEFIWYPSEVDTSIRQGWFYHKHEDDKVRSLETLLEIYYNSVGGNASLLLNIPVDGRGLVHENDAKRLQELGTYIKEAFASNVAPKAKVTTDTAYEDAYDVTHVLTADRGYFKPAQNEESVTLRFELDQAYAINHVVLQEELTESQRIESFEIWVKKADEMEKVYGKTVVGSKRICKFDAVNTDVVEVRITASRIYPTLKFVGIYEAQ